MATGTTRPLWVSEEEIVRPPLSHRDEIRAVSTDFTSHPGMFTDLVEVLGVAGGRRTRSSTWASG